MAFVGVLTLVLVLLASPGQAQVIGPSFADEVAAAGIVDRRFAWGVDGVIHYHPAVSQATRDAVAAVLAAHNPATTTLDVKGFKAWLKANMSFALRNNVAKAYPNFLADLNAQEWADFQAGCIAANTAIPLTTGQWTAFKNAVTTYKIPITLP